MKKTFMLLAASLAAVLSADAASAQSKIASIDMETVVLSHPKTEAHNKELLDLKKESEEILEVKRSAARNIAADLEAKLKDAGNEALSDAARKEKIAEARDLEKKLREKEDEMRTIGAGLQRNLRKLELDLFNVKMDAINAAVGKIAKDDGYDYIVDSSAFRTGAPIPVVVYANPALDITDKVIAVIGGKRVDKDAVLPADDAK